MNKLTLLFLFISFASQAQLKLSGEWQGIIAQRNQNWKDGKPIYLTISVVGGLIDGKIREENYNSTVFVISKVSGKLQNKVSIELNEEKVLKQSEKTFPSCFKTLNLKYNEKTGYLEGDFVNKKCPESSGKLILYQSKFDFNDRNEPLMNHSWFARLNSDLENDLSSPIRRLEELRNFKFEPIYFDYGKNFLKEEYKSYLLELIKMVKSHSDLRIKITGHTDSDGSDSYNDKLSKKRTDVIISFFESNGLRRDRIVVDFKGEKKPIDSNKTDDGKRKNRRVDFEFI